MVEVVSALYESGQLVVETEGHSAQISNEIVFICSFSIQVEVVMAEDVAAVSVVLSPTFTLQLSHPYHVSCQLTLASIIDRRWL